MKPLGKATGKQQRKPNGANSSITTGHDKVVTAYFEPIDRFWLDQTPLPSRSTSVSNLTFETFPQVQCLDDRVENFPIDDYPTKDPFLPWIHDYFPTQNGSYIQFVAQNKRKCNTGKDHEETMKFWGPQVSLFQPVPIDIDWSHENTSSGQHQPIYRLGRSPDNATIPETRFICRFHNHDSLEATTFSEYSFNYELVTWRKGQSTMMAIKGKDSAQYWLSQLLFRCPVPAIFQNDIRHGRHGSINIQHQWMSQLWLDLVPIRTPARIKEFLFTERHVGPKHLKGIRVFNTTKAWTANHVLPALSDSGRWANLPICQLPSSSRANERDKPVQSISKRTTSNQTTFRLVACTWTAASYTRRGDAVAVDDSAKRLREWIVFHLLVGFDHLYVYDNTQSLPSPLLSIANEFRDRVTYHSWRCKICNNNPPTDPNPGEWSSQYSAESSCRERYGPTTEWMAFIDTDEYMVPLVVPPKSNLTKNLPRWHAVLDGIDINTSRVLKMKSSRAKPRHDLMEILDDQFHCQNVGTIFENLTSQPCLAPRRNETFLKVYNCDSIKPPRPLHQERAMKQIYRTDYVLSHYVHYSTVTKEVATYFANHPASRPGANVSYIRSIRRKTWLSREVFLDELTQGILIHARSILPHETMHRSHACYLNATLDCTIGFPCPQSVEFVDGASQPNAFHDQAGDYCNCWPNEVLDNVLIPRLAALLHQKGSG